MMMIGLFDFRLKRKKRRGNYRENKIRGGGRAGRVGTFESEALAGIYTNEGVCFESL
jgi:hypothetical protein